MGWVGWGVRGGGARVGGGRGLGAGPDGSMGSGLAQNGQRARARGSSEAGVTEGEIREQLVKFARQMIRTGLVRGTSGNLSARIPGTDTCLVTPSGVDYEAMEPKDAVAVDLFG